MPGSISPAARDTEGACSCRRDPTKDLVPPFLCRGAGLTRLALAPPPAASCGRSFRRAYSALEVDEQQRDSGGRNSRGARSYCAREPFCFAWCHPYSASMDAAAFVLPLGLV